MPGLARWPRSRAGACPTREEWSGQEVGEVTPTSASWLNLVERFFRDLTEDQIRRGVFSSVKELEASIVRYLEQGNANPLPYRWTAHPNDILEKEAR